MKLFEPNPSSIDSLDELGTGSSSIYKGEWRCVETPYLKQLKGSHRARARAALRWRPRFLKALGKSCNWADALKAANVCYNTVKLHQGNDPEFAAQVREAGEEGTQLLHDKCFQDALEGHCEPIYWQGEKVGEIKKYDTRLRIEMLRAYMPERFTRPGSVNVHLHKGPDNLIVFTPELQAEVQKRRRAALERMKAMEEGIKPEKIESIDDLIKRSYGHAMP